MLRDALNAALAEPTGVAMASGVFTNDGEGYSVNIHILIDGEMQRLATPYTDEIARCGRDALWPHLLPIKPKHPRAHETEPQP